MQPSIRYRAFISYSHSDRKSAARLQTALENFRLPRQHAAGAASPARLRPIFRDREELSSSHDLTAAIRDALDESEHLVVVCSPHAAASRWVAAEIQHFIQRHGPEKVLCFIVAGSPNSPDPALECLPEPLRRSQSGREVLAADARKQGDGWTDAVLKTVAGLTGVSFADLARRQHARFRRRAMVWASCGLVLATIFGALAIYALQQAEAAKKSAKSAELIAGYLGEVLSQFTPRSADNSARAALLPLIDASSRADRLSRLENNPAALLRVRRILARAYLELNAADRARPLLEKNIELATAVFGPDAPDTLANLSTLGNTLNALGDNEAGAKIHRRLLDAAIREHGEKSEETLQALTNLANSLQNAGRRKEAFALRTRVYQLGRQFMPPDHLYFQGARRSYACVLWDHNRLDEALVVAEEVHRDQLKSPGPGKLDTCETEGLLGELYEELGKPELAVTVYASAAEGLSSIHGPDDARAIFCAFRLVNVLHHLGRKDQAAAASKQYFGRPPDARKLAIIGKKPSDLPR